MLVVALVAPVLSQPAEGICLENNTDYHGNDCCGTGSGLWLTVTPGERAPFECQHACQGTSQCLFSTTWLNNGHCYLKTSDRGRNSESAPFGVSGPKFCPTSLPTSSPGQPTRPPTRPPSDLPTPGEPASGTCSDTDYGAADRHGGSCSFYDMPGESGAHGNCDYYDDWDFSANSMCCACGGGVTGEVPRPRTRAAAVIPQRMPVLPSSVRPLSHMSTRDRKSVVYSCVDYHT